MADSMAEHPGPPSEGHLFRFTFTSRGSHRVVGDPTYYESDWWGDEITFEVRGWSLRDALAKASTLPFPVLMGVGSGEEEVCDGG